MKNKDKNFEHDLGGLSRLENLSGMEMKPKASYHVILHREDLNLENKDLDIGEINTTSFKSSSLTREQLNRAEIILFVDKNNEIKTIKSKYYSPPNSFIQQVSNLKLVKVTTPRIFLEWTNTETGRDKNMKYERVVNDSGYVYYVNFYNESMLVFSEELFFKTLEEMYQSLVK